MEQMEFDTLEVPASGLRGPPRLRQPKMDKSFLQQIVAKSQVRGDSANHAEQALPDRFFIDEHNSCLGLLEPTGDATINRCARKCPAKSLFVGHFADAPPVKQPMRENYLEKPRTAHVPVAAP